MKIISCRNDKGGVGKTTSTGTIAHGLAKQGYKVLALDGDPQGNLTSWFDPDYRYTFKDILESFKNKAKQEPLDLANVIVEVRENLYLLPTDKAEELKEFETKLNGDPGFINRHLRPEFEKLGFDFVVIDYAPAWNTFEISLSHLVDEFLILIEPSMFSLFGMEQQYLHLNQAREVTNRDIQCSCVVVNKVDERKTKVELPMRNQVREHCEKINQKYIEINTDSNYNKIQSLKQTPYDDANSHLNIRKQYDQLLQVVIGA